MFAPEQVAAWLWTSFRAAANSVVAVSQVCGRDTSVAGDNGIVRSSLERSYALARLGGGGVGGAIGWQGGQAASAPDRTHPVRIWRCALAMTSLVHLVGGGLQGQRVREVPAHCEGARALEHLAAISFGLEGPEKRDARWMVGVTARAATLCRLRSLCGRLSMKGSHCGCIHAAGLSMDPSRYGLA